MKQKQNILSPKFKCYSYSVKQLYHQNNINETKVFYQISIYKKRLKIQH